MCEFSFSSMVQLGGLVGEVWFRDERLGRKNSRPQGTVRVVEWNRDSGRCVRKGFVYM